MIALYADDTKIGRGISSVNDCLDLQNQLDKLCKWSTTWGLHFNVSKCKIISFFRGSNKIKFNYRMNGLVLESVETFTDLGI